MSSSYEQKVNCLFEPYQADHTQSHSHTVTHKQVSFSFSFVVFFSLFHFSHLPFRQKDGESIFFLVVFHIFANGRRIEATHRAQGVFEN